MMNESSMADLMSYRRVVLGTSVVVLLLLASAIVLSWVAGALVLIKPLLGAFFGSLLASINVVALGYAFYQLVIKNAKKRVVLWPAGTFLFMCAVALALALRQPDYILGFALGLTTPLIFGAIIALRA